MMLGFISQKGDFCEPQVMCGGKLERASFPRTRVPERQERAEGPWVAQGLVLSFSAFIRDLRD